MNVIQKEKRFVKVHLNTKINWTDNKLSLLIDMLVANPMRHVSP